VDRLEIDGLPAGDVLHVEAFDHLLRLAPRLGVRLQAPSATRLVFLKRLGLDRAARSWVLRARHLRVPVATHRPILFLSEMATPSTLEPSRAVADALPKSAYSVAVADPRASTFWTMTGRRSHPVLVELAQQRRILTHARREAARVWREIESAPPRLEYRGEDLSREALDILRPLVLRSLPWLHVDCAALRHTLEAIQPRWVVVPSDQHRFGRLAAYLRRQCGHRLYVLQHGLPQDELGYVPVIADRIAVWSESSAAWFIHRGTRPEQLAVLGNPRHDAMVVGESGGMPAPAGGEYGITGRPRLLVAMSSIADETNQRLVDLVLAVLQRLPQACMII
jgi:hypothetical protein